MYMKLLYGTLIPRFSPLQDPVLKWGDPGNRYGKVTKSKLYHSTLCAFELAIIMATYPFHPGTQQANDNHFSVMNATLRENCAELGGGATFFSSHSAYADFSNSISFITNSTWSDNSARVGAAVDISPFFFFWFFFSIKVYTSVLDIQ